MNDKRITKPQDIRRLMQEQINIIRRSDRLDEDDKAKIISTLSNTALKAIQHGQLEERLDKIEKAMYEKGEL